MADTNLGHPEGQVSFSGYLMPGQKLCPMIKPRDQQCDHITCDQNMRTIAQKAPLKGAF
jgi:hypothetical protein